jgi:lipopolysaccharide exporter
MNWSRLSLRRKWTGEHGFLRSVAVLASGTVLAQGLTVLISPVLTRVYSPDAMGRLGLYMAFVGFASVGASLRFETAIVSASDRKEAANLVALSLVSLVPTSLLGTAALYVLTSRSLLGFGGLPTYTVALLLPSLLSTSGLTILRYWMVREGAFGLISRVQVTQSLARSVGQLVLALLGWYGLILGDLLGRLAGIGRMARASWEAVRDLAFPLDRARLLSIARKYRKFPQYSLPSALIDTLALNIPLPLISGLYGAESAGYFVLVQGVLSLPSALLASAVGDAFHSRMAEYARETSRKAVSFFLRAGGGLLAVGLLPALVMTIGGPFLFSHVFGRNWTTAGAMAAAMAPWFLSQLVVSPLSRVVLVFQGQETKLIFDFLSLASAVGALVGGYHLGLTLLEAIRLLSLVNIISYSVYFLLLYRIVRRHSLGANVCAE